MPNLKTIDSYYLAGGNEQCFGFAGRTYTYPGGPVLRLQPRLFPSLALCAESTRLVLDDLHVKEQVVPRHMAAPDELSTPSDNFALFECEGLVKSIDETMAFLSEWRDRAIRTSDVKSLLALADRLKDADWDRVIHLA